MMRTNRLFVTGIGTGVGKTVVSAILRKASGAAYWKPVQAGDLDELDSEKVKLLSGIDAPVFPEALLLNTPASPHYAAEIDGVTLTENSFQLPDYEGNLLIEGAGGVTVPLNNEGLIYADIVKKWNIPVVVVSRHYLGSINHTLLTLNFLKAQGIPVKALIFVGKSTPATEQVILQHFPIKQWCRIDETEDVNSEFVAKEAAKIDFELFE